MESEREQRRQAYVEKTRSEVASLVECGVRMGGNAFSPADAEALAGREDGNEARLPAGMVAYVCGMRFLNLGGFAAALGDPRQKQVMWARLKQVPPLAEPY